MSDGSWKMLISFEDVAGIDLIGHVIEGAVIAVGDDGIGLGLEEGEVVDHTAAEEGDAVFEGGFIDDDLGAFGFDAFHYALDGALAEVVRVGLHGEAVNANDDFALLGGVEGTGAGVVARFAEYLISDVVLAGAVGFHDGFDEVLGYIVEVGKELFGVFGEAVAAVAEAGIVIVRADARIEAYAVDDGLCVKAFHL